MDTITSFPVPTYTVSLTELEISASSRHNSHKKINFCCGSVYDRWCLRSGQLLLGTSRKWPTRHLQHIQPTLLLHLPTALFAGATSQKLSGWLVCSQNMEWFINRVPELEQTEVERWWVKENITGTVWTWSLPCGSGKSSWRFYSSWLEERVGCGNSLIQFTAKVLLGNNQKHSTWTYKWVL